MSEKTGRTKNALNFFFYHYFWLGLVIVLVTMITETLLLTGILTTFL